MVRKRLFVGVAYPARIKGSRAAAGGLAMRSSSTEHVHLSAYRRYPTLDQLKVLRKHINVLKRGKSVELPASSDFKLESKGYLPPMVYDAKPVVVVEGELLFARKNIRELFDLRIYLEAPLRKGNDDDRARGLDQRNYAHYIINTRQPWARIQKKIQDIIDEELKEEPSR